MRNLSQFPDQIFIVCDSNGGSWCFRLFYPLTPCSDQFCVLQRQSYCNWNLGWDFGTARFECTDEERNISTVFPRKLFSWTKISPKETEP